MTVLRTAFDSAQPIYTAPNAKHSCRMCAGGCRSYDVLLTEREARRLESSWWRPLLVDVPDDMPLVVLDAATNQYTLNRVDDRCVFLDTDNLCIVHKSAGVDAKPLACQIFPFHAVQTPAGLNLSLNVSCRRLVEMTETDPALDTAEAVRLLSQTQAIATLTETVVITPDVEMTYADYSTWTATLIDILGQPAASWGIVRDQVRSAAELLLLLPATDTPTDLRGMFQALYTQIRQPMTVRSTLSALYRRSEPWLTMLLNSEGLWAAAIETSDAPPVFLAQIAGQWLAGDQVASHRTARSGWTALLAAFVGGIYGTLIRIESGQRADHALNEATADAIDLWLSPAGQLALTEPNQQAFLRGLASSQVYI